MKASKKKLIALTLFAVLFATAVSFGGGCGGSSDSDPKDIHVIGKLHGDYADELTALYDVMAPDGETDAPVIVSRESGLNLTDDEALLLKKYLMAGQAVGIEHVTESEVNLFLDKLGFKIDDAIASGDTYYEYYGVKVVGDDVFSYVMLNDDEVSPELKNVIAENIVVSEDNALKVVSQDTAPDALPDYVVLSGDTLIATSGDEVQKLKITELPDEKPAENNGFKAADRMVNWMYDTEAQKAEAMKGRSEAAVKMKKDGLRGAGSANLKDLTRLYQKTYDCSIWDQVFKITVDIYSCHVYNKAEEGTTSPDSDWFFIKQKAYLNPSKNYELSDSKKMKGTPIISGYMVNYEFENTPVEGDCKTYVPGLKLRDATPDNTTGQSTTSSGMSVNFGGNVGFSGFSATGGLSAGVSYSDSESFSTSDTVVTNNSFAGSGNNVTKWKYEFSRPSLYGSPCIGFQEFRDAPANARSLFQPVNQWIWIVPSDAREKAKGFNMKFKWKTGSSRGTAYVWWVKIQSLKHYDHWNHSDTMYVPFCSYPPLIAGSDLKFTAAAGDKPLTIACARDWKADSDSSWCKIVDTATTGDDGSLSVSGTKDEAGNFEVQVTANDTGRNRTAWITLKTQDGKGETKVKVFQSKN